jgi:hypothetical protein
MNQQPAEYPMTVDELEAAFAGRWGIWLSDTGRWWATRRAPLTSAELTVGAAPFLRAEDPAQLAGLIKAQENSPDLQAVTEDGGPYQMTPGYLDRRRRGSASAPPASVSTPAIGWAAADDQELASLQQEFRQFQIARETIGDRVRFVSLRQEPAARPHTVICEHLAELAAVLRNTAVQRAGTGAPAQDGAPAKPEPGGPA